MTDNELAKYGYENGTPVSFVQITAKGIQIDRAQPAKLTPEPLSHVTWGKSEFSHFSSRVSRSSLYTPEREAEEMNFEAPASMPIKLFLYVNEANKDAAVDYLKRNFKREALKRIAQLKAGIQFHEAALAELGL